MCYKSYFLIKESQKGSHIILQVTPTTGEAFVTNFTFNATGWTDSDFDTPLIYYFGCDSGVSPIGWKGPFIEEDPAYNFTLPLSKFVE